MSSPKDSAKHFRFGLASAAALLAWLMLPLLHLLPLGAGAAEEPARPKRALALYWRGKDLPANVTLDKSIQAVFRSAPAGSIEYYAEYLEDNRFPGENQSLLLRNYLREKYADRKIDVIIALSSASLNFLLKYRSDLFPNTPIVFHTYNRAQLGRQAEAGLTGVVVDSAFRNTLDLALRLHPSTEQALIITGTPERDKKLEAEVRQELKEFESRVALTYLTDLPLDELIARVKNAPAQSIIFYVRHSQDEPGKTLNTYDTLTVVAQSAGVPVYTAAASLLGRGSVGGYAANLEDCGTRAAEIALRIANGARPQDIQVVNVPIVPMFDWRQLQRWGISDDRLPPGSKVSFKDPTIWEQYKWYIIGFISLSIVKGLTIVGLLVQRAKRKWAEEAMFESEERFSKAFHSSPQPMSLTTLEEGRYLDVNDRFLEASGYTREEVIGHLSLELNIWENPAARAELITPLKEGRMVRNWETKFGTKQGDFRVFLSSAELIELGGRPCVLVASSDITERKRAEAAKLRQSALRADVSAALAGHEGSLQSMLQQSAEALVRHLDAAFARIWTLNHDERVLELQASAGLYTHLNGGHSRVPVGELKIGQIAEDRQPHLTNDVDNDPRINDQDWARDQGMVAFAGYPLLVEDRVVGVMAMFARHPLTEDTVEALATVAAPIAQGIERKRAEEALRESEERARRALVEQMLAGVIECDATGKFMLVNQRFCEIAGYTEAELLEMRVGDITHPDDATRISELYRRLVETGASYVAEKRCRRKDGSEVWVNSNVSPVRNAQGVVEKAVAVVIDITDRKRAEREREQLFKQEKAARAEAQAANQSKDEFLAVVSHELRSPLNSILGYARLLRAGAADAAQIRQTVEIIERNGKMQLQLIEDLLDSARIISGKLKLEVQLVEIVSVITAALDMVRPAAQAKHIELLTDLDPLAGQITGDPDRLKQVVLNLLTNAIKFTSDGGRVELRKESVNQHVRITVSDTGKGIEPEFLPFVFDRFRQSDSSSARRFGGLGLGLSLVKQLVELHGGTVEAASDGPGCGATFTVMLPQRAARTETFIPRQPRAAPAREVRTEDAIPLDQVPSLAGVRVLVVDDQEEARVLLMAILGECGAQVTAVSSGIEALAILADPPGGERPDVLILDIAMPDEDGYKVLERVRALEAECGIEQSSRIPAIALTAHGRSEDRLKALAAGFRVHVAKPVEPAELALVIASLTEWLGVGRSA